MIVRSDLPTGVAAAQAVHAAGESSPGDLSPGTYALALSVPGEDGLRGVAELVQQHGLEFVSICENDAPWSGQLMAIGLRPCPRSSTRFLSSLPLYRGQVSGVVAQMQSTPKGEVGASQTPGSTDSRADS